MDVGGWLRGLGLGQYEDKFRDNKVDTDLLPRLTADDLRDIAFPRSAIGGGCSTPSPRWPPRFPEEARSIERRKTGVLPDAPWNAPAA